MAPPKNAVGLDTFANRRSDHDNPRPRIMDQTTPSRIQGQQEATRSSTAGEKYKPRTVPIIQSPNRRIGTGVARRPPATLTAAQASRGPMVQGSGALTALKSAPAGTATSSALRNGIIVADDSAGDQVGDWAARRRRAS